MQKLAPSRETSLMRLSIIAWACLDTPNTQPPTAGSPAGIKGRPQVKLTCRKSARYHHTIMGLHRFSHPVCNFSDGEK